MKRFILLAALALTGCKKKEPFEILAQPATPRLPKLWQVPDFSLIERNGQPFTRAGLAGKVCVVDFFYTTCPGPCPMMSSRLSALQEKLGAQPEVRLVSISLDPAKDTPEVLRQYAARFNAGANWLFCTGDKAAIYDLITRGFKLAAVEERNNPEPITHSTKLVLVDRAGWVRGFYEGVGEDQNTKLAADIGHLLREQP